MNECQIFIKHFNATTEINLFVKIYKHIFILSDTKTPFLLLEQNKFKCDVVYVHTLQVSTW